VSYPGRGYNPGDPNRGDADGLYTNDFGGTSSATPLAAGVAALVLSVNPKLNRDDLRGIMRATADKIGSGYDAGGHSTDFGYGRVNAQRAVTAAAAA
jgi:subtilisin family serine protease